MPQVCVSTANKVKLVRSCAIRDDDEDDVSAATTVTVNTVTDTTNGDRYSPPNAAVRGSKPYKAPKILTLEEFLEFLAESINKCPRDQRFFLYTENELVTFVIDKSRNELLFPRCITYYRLIIHRCANVFGLDHELVKGTEEVAVRKTERMHIPDFTFDQFITIRFHFSGYGFRKSYSTDNNNNRRMSESPKRLLLKRDIGFSTSAAPGKFGDNNSMHFDQRQQQQQRHHSSSCVGYNTKQEQQKSSLATETSTAMFSNGKNCLKNSNRNVRPKSNSTSTSVDYDLKYRNLSFEEREEQYGKARKRIFESEENWDDMDSSQAPVELLKAKEPEETKNSNNDKNSQAMPLSVLTRTSTAESESSGYKTMPQSHNSESYTPSPNTLNNDNGHSNGSNSDENLYANLETNTNTKTKTNVNVNVVVNMNGKENVPNNENEVDGELEHERERHHQALGQQPQQEHCPLKQHGANMNDVDYTMSQPISNYCVAPDNLDFIPFGTIIINPDTKLPFTNLDGSIHCYDPANMPEPLYHFLLTMPLSRVNVHFLQTSVDDVTAASSRCNPNTINIPKTGTTPPPLPLMNNANPYSYGYHDSLNNNSMPGPEYGMQQALPPAVYYATETDQNSNGINYNYLPLQQGHLQTQYLTQSQLPPKDIQIMNAGNMVDLTSHFGAMTVGQQPNAAGSVTAVQSRGQTESPSAPPVSQAHNNMGPMTATQLPVVTATNKYPNTNAAFNQNAVTYYYQQPQQQFLPFNMPNDCVYVTPTAHGGNSVGNDQVYNMLPPKMPFVSQPNNRPTTQPHQPLFFYQRPQVPVNYPQVLTSPFYSYCANPSMSGQQMTVFNPYSQAVQYSNNKMVSYVPLPAAAAVAANGAHHPNAQFFPRQTTSSASGYHHGNNGKGYTKPGYRNTRSFHQYSSKQYHHSMGMRTHQVSMGTMTPETPVVSLTSIQSTNTTIDNNCNESISDNNNCGQRESGYKYADGSSNQKGPSKKHKMND